LKRPDDIKLAPHPPLPAAPAVERTPPTTAKGKEQARDVSPREPDSGFGRIRSQEQSLIASSRIAPLAEMGPERFLLGRRSAQPQPTGHVTIGRVEVRAVRAVQQSRSTSKEQPSQPVMKLDEYLRGRSRGARDE